VSELQASPPRWYSTHARPRVLTRTAPCPPPLGPISVHVLAFLDKTAKDFEKLSSELKAAGASYRTQALTIYMPSSEKPIMQVVTSQAAGLDEDEDDDQSLPSWMRSTSA
jgi:hypothetical protein